MMLFGAAHHGVNVSFNFNPRSQNVPKTKVERAKPVEITGGPKKVLGEENID